MIGAPPLLGGARLPEMASSATSRCYFES